MARNILNIDSGLRQINPRSGSSVFVDLSSNQIISGIKRFLNNLITNSDVNFNTTANLGRIVFNPNEPAGSGSQIVSIYTTDENNGNSWIFDSNGNLYYIATGLNPIKIMLSATGEITSIGNINCGNILKTDTIQARTEETNIDMLSNLYLKASFFMEDPSNNGTRVLINPSSGGTPGESFFTLFKDNTGYNRSLNFDCDGSLYYYDGDYMWKFHQNGDLITEGFLQTDKIQSNYFGGVRPFIKLDNRFIDPDVSSIDIISTYIGFPHPSQTLSTASKYFYIKPLSTGNFQTYINEIPNIILSSDWATTKINSQYIWSINDIVNQNAIILNGLTTGSGNRLEIFGTAGGIRKLYYNTNNELGVIETVTTIWKITGAGAITCSSLNANSGTIQTTGTISSGAITCSALNASAGTIQTTGSISGGAITCSGLNASSGTIQTTGNISGVDITSTNIIYGRSINLSETGYLNVNNITSSTSTGSYPTKIALSNEFINASLSSLDIVASYIGFASPTQTLTTASKYMYIEPLTAGNFQMLINNIANKILLSDWATTKISSQYIWNLNNISNQNVIILDSLTTSSNRLQIYGVGGGTRYLFFNTSNNIGVFNTATGANVWSIDGTTGNINTIGTLTYATLSATSLLTNSISPISPSTTINIFGALQLSSNLISTGFLRSDFLYSYIYSTYQNVIRMNTLTTNASISGMTLSSQYIDFVHPSTTPTVSSKYFFILTTSDGNASMNINNISGKVLGTQHSSFGVVIRQVSSDYRWVFNALSYTFAQSIIGFTIAGTSAGAVIMSSPSTVTYANSSDYRLKQDITHLDDALDSLMLLKPVIYRMKHDVEAGYNMFFHGFLAHEVENIIPNIVSGVKDDPNMMQQLDYSKFTPLLTGAVQELNEKVEKQQILIEKQQILIDKQQILIDSLISRLDKLENNNYIVEGTKTVPLLPPPNEIGGGSGSGSGINDLLPPPDGAIGCGAEGLPEIAF
jgi:hypothetical protein